MTTPPRLTANRPVIRVLTAEQTTHRSATLALRLPALGGLALLLVGFFMLFWITMSDAYEPGDGAAGGFIAAGFWALNLSGLSGLAAAALPEEAVKLTARRQAVLLQYALLIAGPVLAALD